MAAFFVYKADMDKRENPDDKTVTRNPSVMRVGFTSCCPRCGEGRLYKSVLKPADKCLHCNLDFNFIETGDGPAVFVILIIGFLVTALAMALQVSVSPPLWVHMVIWTPLIIVLAIMGLQFSKSIMITLQYQTRAEQGVIEGSEQ